jgi:fructosamine-3-kinase
MNAGEAVAALLGRPVAKVTSLGGAHRVRLTDGDEVVAKHHTQPSALRAEMAGLRWLASTPTSGNLHERSTGAPGGPPISTLPAGTDDSGALTAADRETARSSPSERSIGAPGGPPNFTLPAGTDSSGARAAGCPQVPAVLGFSDEWLVIEAVPKGQASPAAAERFGRELAALHATGAEVFGAPPPGGPVDAWIGLAPMRNVAGRRWPEWYAEHRIRPYLRQAVDQGSLRDPAPVDAVCARIDSLAGPDERPARLHGDLWSGNVLWAGDSAWLIDPAAHGGHRETDLAMLHLFGCAHLDRIVAAYDEAAPLADGWRERIALHQLFPLLVHAVLFGGGYGAQAVAAARSLGAERRRPPPG